MNEEVKAESHAKKAGSSGTPVVILFLVLYFGFIVGIFQLQASVDKEIYRERHAQNIVDESNALARVFNDISSDLILFNLTGRKVYLEREEELLKQIPIRFRSLRILLQEDDGTGANLNQLEELANSTLKNLSSARKITGADQGEAVQISARDELSTLAQTMSEKLYSFTKEEEKTLSLAPARLEQARAFLMQWLALGAVVTVFFAIYLGRTLSRLLLFVASLSLIPPSVQAQGSYNPGDPMRYERQKWAMQGNFGTSGWVFNRPSSGIAQAGLILPAILDTTLSLKGAKEGDFVQAHISQNVMIGGSFYIPGGSVLQGVLANPGDKHVKAGDLTIEFEQMRFPNGQIISISAHLLGNLANYRYSTDPRRSGSAAGNALNSAWRGGMGSGIGAMAGTGMESAFHGGGGSFGYGSAMGGEALATGMTLLERMIYSPHKDVLIHGGSNLQIQLDQPVEIPGPTHGPPPWAGQSQIEDPGRADNSI